jgi:hypothetical protein
MPPRHRCVTKIAKTRLIRLTLLKGKLGLSGKNVACLRGSGPPAFTGTPEAAKKGE